MGDPAALLNTFEQQGWKCRPFERMLDVVHANPAKAAHLLTLAMQRRSPSATFLDAAISFVPEGLLQELAELAVDAFAKDRENQVAENTIAYLALQSVENLQPHLLRFFFDLKPNARSYYANWPWRGATDRDVEKLLQFLSAALIPEEKIRAFCCVLESRNSKRIAAAIAAIDMNELPYDKALYLRQIGFDGPDRPLFIHSAFHIRFPMSSISNPSKPAWLQPGNHPTWTLQSTQGVQRFGGVVDCACSVCGSPLHNLISLDPVPEGLGLLTSRQLQISTCLSCLGWSKETLFFRHDSQGKPTAIETTRVVPEFPVGPLKEMSVELSPTPERWKWQDWALANGRENLHRIGGHPTWIQSSQYPKCPDCDHLMCLLLQLDSDLPTEDGGEWLWGSGGICYVFWCNKCQVSGSLWQCT
jgi:hypothetical protein